MILSDRTIKEELDKGRIVIEPLGEGCIQPASVDLRLDRELRVFLSPDQYSYIDVRGDMTGLTELEEIPDPHPFILEPGQFVLASTLEYVEVPDDIVARLEGKSSLGRLGLLVHATAGYVDPGFRGQLTLEISNVARAKMALYYEMKISQISFIRTTTPVDRPYGSRELESRYQGQLGPTPMRSHPGAGDAVRRHRQYANEKTDLRLWLDGSPYEGSISRLAAVLDARLKTVEDWVYGRNQPAAENRRKLFEVTGLPVYAPEQGSTQPLLFPSDDKQIHLAPATVEGS